AEYRAFLGTLADRGRWDGGFAERAAVSVMCHLQQRLDLGEEKEVRAALPPKMGELATSCSVHRGLPGERIGRDELLGRVASDLGIDANRAESVVRTVFAALREWVGETDAEELDELLPHDLLPLWRLPS
ncbi:MAG: DUF2267 domain-containing protein, partial [Myxococcales bacterium]